MTLHEMQMVELDIAKVFLRICDKYKLHYYMLGGTLLGAVRHRGFIPWDDDIDLGMPRPDYEKFMSIVENEIPENYGLKTFLNSDTFIKYHSRLENRDFEFESSSYGVSRRMFAWIDIFPLDGMPRNKFLFLFHKLHLLYLRAMTQLSQFEECIDFTNKNRPWFEKTLIWAGKYLGFGRRNDPKKIMLKLDKTLKKYSYVDSKYLVNFMGAYKFREMFDKEKYKDGVMYDFEDIQLCGPVDYDFVLKQLYGDYMTPPSDKDKNRHNTKVIET